MATIKGERHIRGRKNADAGNILYLNYLPERYINRHNKILFSIIDFPQEHQMEKRQQY